MVGYPWMHLALLNAAFLAIWGILKIFILGGNFQRFSSPKIDCVGGSTTTTSTPTESLHWLLLRWYSTWVTRRLAQGKVHWLDALNMDNQVVSPIPVAISGWLPCIWSSRVSHPRNSDSHDMCICTNIYIYIKAHEDMSLHIHTYMYINYIILYDLLTYLDHEVLINQTIKD